MPRGCLEWRQLAPAGWFYPRRTHVSSLCQVCVSVYFPNIYFPEHTGPSLSFRMFSLDVALPSQTLVSLIYKASAGITVSVELKTVQAGEDNRDVHDDKCKSLMCSLCIPAFSVQALFFKNWSWHFQIGGQRGKSNWTLYFLFPFKQEEHKNAKRHLIARHISFQFSEGRCISMEEPGQ